MNPRNVVQICMSQHASMRMSYVMAICDAIIIAMSIEIAGAFCKGFGQSWSTSHPPSHLLILTSSRGPGGFQVQAAWHEVQYHRKTMG